MDTHLGVTTVVPLESLAGDTTSAALTSSPQEEVPQNPASLTAQASISVHRDTSLMSQLSNSELRKQEGGQSLTQL